MLFILIVYMFKPKYIYMGYYSDKNTEVIVLNTTMNKRSGISMKELKLESPNSIEKGFEYGHFINADEMDAPKVEQAEVIQDTAIKEAFIYIIKLIKAILSFLTFGCI